MKKFLATSLLALLASTAFADDFSPTFTETFLDNFLNCTPYKETRSVDFFGEKLSIVQQLDGWVNDRCVYKTGPADDESDVIICNFTKDQILEIIAASQKTGEQTYSNNGITYTSDNPVDVVMTKFMNDKTTCPQK